jgi:hypothetical protein
MDLEDYKPRHNDYGSLRDIHQEQQQSTVESDKPVREPAPVQTQPTSENTQAPEPVRPEEHYDQSYARGRGDYVTETRAATWNDRMINADYYAAQQASQASNRAGDREAANREPAQTDSVEHDAKPAYSPNDHAPSREDLPQRSEAVQQEVTGRKESSGEARQAELTSGDEEAVLENRQATEEIVQNLRESSDRSADLTDKRRFEIARDAMMQRHDDEYEAVYNGSGRSEELPSQLEQRHDRERTQLAHFSKSTDDHEGFQTRGDEAAALLEDGQATEEIAQNLRESSGRGAADNRGAEREVTNREPEQTDSVEHDARMAQASNDRTPTRADLVQQNEGAQQEITGRKETPEDTREAEVNELAEAYEMANPGSGSTPEEIRNAAYFAKSVDDPARFAPRSDEETALVEDRQATEEIVQNLRESSGRSSELTSEERQALMEERMQTHMAFQNQYSMSM